MAERLLSHCVTVTSLTQNTDRTLHVLHLFVNAYGVDFMTSFKAFSDGVKGFNAFSDGNCGDFGNGIGGLSSIPLSESSLNGTVFYLVILSFLYAFFSA